jgi:uncharacterized cupin superfamily protein
MTVPVDRRLHDGDDVCGWTVVTFDGFKTRGESALVRQGVAITGDAFWGVPAGALALMPDEKLTDPVQAALSARRLLAYRPLHLLVGDGCPVYHRAYAALADMLDARPGLFARRINLEDVRPRGDASPAPFGATFEDVGRMLGAERLGYVLGRLAPGDAYCPYHWHTREEEALLVWRGRASLRTPAGTFALRAGDLVAFPCGPQGAHRLENDSDEPCEVVIFANTDAGDVCYYPDSQKMVVDQTDTLVRIVPQLDYFDGELPS